MVMGTSFATPHGNNSWIYEWRGIHGYSHIYFVCPRGVKNFSLCLCRSGNGSRGGRNYWGPARSKNFRDMWKWPFTMDGLDSGPSGHRDHRLYIKLAGRVGSDGISNDRCNFMEHDHRIAATKHHPLAPFGQSK